MKTSVTRTSIDSLRKTEKSNQRFAQVQKVKNYFYNFREGSDEDISIVTNIPKSFISDRRKQAFPNGELELLEDKKKNVRGDRLVQVHRLKSQY